MPVLPAGILHDICLEVGRLDVKQTSVNYSLTPQFLGYLRMSRTPTGVPQIIIAPVPAKLIPKGGYGIWLCTKWMFLIVVIYYILGILHSLVYTFLEKACIIELNADVETGNSKFEIR